MRALGRGIWMIVAPRQEGNCFFWRACRERQSRRDFDCTHAARVIYVLDRETKLLFMPLWIAGFWGELCSMLTLRSPRSTEPT